MIEEALFKLLSTDSGVSAIASTRVYISLMPESPTFPAIVYRMISEKTFPAMGADVGIVRRRMQVDCWGETATDARNLADAVIAALSRYSGTVTYTGGSTVISDIYRDGVIDLYDEHARKFQRAVDFIVFYQG